ncbi:hypothetical protein JVU11DRAFT_6845 [Chiua virens]|nr:hypothetical protein JVU11DRAFT_6845 [Chiua virens]
MDDLEIADENPPSTSTTNQNGHSGITIVLPSLRALKAANAGKKSKSKPDLDQRPKIPRPVKLKPLKEVLTKMITQIKKKDDYAFFIRPVDPAQVPGYLDMIKNPMDFGTMTVKVAKGKYRSLEEFTTDFRLVTTNTKTFNPPGSIYYTEADRLEAWGLDHIARASAHVIEYETDWNIDIEQDEDATSQQPVNIDDEVSTPRDLDGSMVAGSPAPSMTPAPGQAVLHSQGKRGPRGPYKRHAQTALSEGLDAAGRMPGVKDGVGVFPPGSDWAELMIALKIKGKRYRTKKERLRFEKEGPPYHPDGSLDYTEMEDPFSILNVFVPDPPTRPQVAPLYPPSSAPMPISAAISVGGTQPPSQMPQPTIYTPIPITIPSNRPTPVLSTLSNLPTQASASTSTSIPSTNLPKKRQHWTIVRNVPARSRGKEKDSDAAVDESKTTWKVPRDAGPADFGTFATFLGHLAASAVGSTVGAESGGAAVGAAEYLHGSDQRLFATIRSTVEHRGVKRKCETDADGAHTDMEQKAEDTFWTDARAEEAWDYLRDVVYGGVDGYAYVRSLAEFVAPPAYLNEPLDDLDTDTKLVHTTPPDNPDATHPLGVPLARYVEDNLVDAVTRGRHGWLRDVLLPVSPASIAIDPTRAALHRDGYTSPFHVRLAELPKITREMASTNTLPDRPLDMAALIRTPDELAQESVLEGGPVEGGEWAAIARALAWSVDVIEALAKQVDKNTCEDASEEQLVKVKTEEETVADPRVVQEEEATGANAMDVDPKCEPEREVHSQPKLETDGHREEEEPQLKRLRMNLLALAKRAPLDQIDKLPAELVPENIRSIVPIAQTVP